MPVAGGQLYLAVPHRGQQAVAVELDLGQPASRFGRGISDRGELWRLALRQRPPHRLRGRRSLPLGVGFRGGRPGWRNGGLDCRRIAAFLLQAVVSLDEQPVVLPAALIRLRAQPHDGELAIQPLAMENKLDLAVTQSVVRIYQRLPGAAIPGLDRSGAVLAVRNGALEIGVLQRVILDMRRDAFVVWVE